jgi:altronate hydrolase
MGTSVLLLNPLDSVGVALDDLDEGTWVAVGQARTRALQRIPAGHKIALKEIAQGELVKKYGQVIGAAKHVIRAGEHVHTHNLGLAEFERVPRPGWEGKRFEQLMPGERRTFQGYLRKDGRAGTRNQVAVISTVNCSAHAARQIAAYFTPERLAAYPNVDGVYAYTHPYGCGVDFAGQNYRLLQRTLAGFALHPNVAAFVLVGLGCESNQASDLVRNYGLTTDALLCPEPLVIQDEGGVRKTVARGIAEIEARLEEVNGQARQTLPIEALSVAVQCGGSDGWSGVTANPLVGWVADKIIHQGGSVVLAETPEIFGAEHFLTSRVASPDLAVKLLAHVRWWEEHTLKLDTALDTNRSPGNAAGGLTTIYEKALGAVAKAGSNPLNGVYDYAEQVKTRGLSFMNSPGNDAISVTGQVAGGCNLVLFTTGRGSVFGCRPAPSIKISTNSSLYRRMKDDMDFDAGRVLLGERIEDLADELFEQVLNVASGEATKSEAQGIGEAEFSPWFLGGVL